MSTRFGTVHKGGSIRFASEDLNECRAFLRDAGLEDGSYKGEAPGWRGDGKAGAIYFDNGKWDAAWWPA